LPIISDTYIRKAAIALNWEGSSGCPSPLVVGCEDIINRSMVVLFQEEERSARRRIWGS
jgi:hypothetical protein